MQSIPLVKNSSLHAVIPASLQMRGMAARKLSCAFQRKLVTAGKAAKAMQEGEAAVAELIAPLLYNVDMETALPPVAATQSLFVGEETQMALEAFVRELHAEGIIGPDDWKGAVPSNAIQTMVNLGLVGAQRIAAKAVELVPASQFDYMPFHVVPNALMEVTGFGSLSNEIMHHPDTGACIVVLSSDPFVTIPLPPTKDERSAICCLIRGINIKGGQWFAIPPDDVLEVIDPMMDELFRDIKTALGDGPLTPENIPAAVRDSLEEYLGEFPDDEEEAKNCFDGLNVSLSSYFLNDRWEMGDGKVEAWMAKGEGRNVELVSKLYAFWKDLAKQKNPAEREIIGDGDICGVFITWDATWEGFQNSIQGLAENFDPVESFKVYRGNRTHSKAESPRPHVAAYRAAVIATTVATAIARIVIDVSPD